MNPRCQRLEEVVALSELGRISDLAALAAHRYTTAGLQPSDFKALACASQMLSDLRDYSSPQMPEHATLQAMPHIAALTETLEAVQRVSGGRGGTAQIERLISDIEAVASGQADASLALQVRSFLHDLSEHTLKRTQRVNATQWHPSGRVCLGAQ